MEENKARENAEKNAKVLLYAMHTKNRIVGVFAEDASPAALHFAFAEKDDYADDHIDVASMDEALGFVDGFADFNDDEKRFFIRGGFIRHGVFLAGHGISLDIADVQDGWDVRLISQQKEWVTSIFHFDYEENGKARAERMLAWLLDDLKLQGWTP